MQDEVQAVIKDALRFGTELPEAFRPVVQGLLEMGLLTDENGNKLEDLSRFKFSGEFEDIFKDMKSVLEDIRDLLAGDLPNAAQRGAEGIRASFRDFEIRVPFKFDVENRPDASEFFQGAETEPFPRFADRPIERVTKSGLAMLDPGDIVGVPPSGSGLTEAIKNLERVIRETENTREDAPQTPVTLTLPISLGDDTIDTLRVKIVDGRAFAEIVERGAALNTHGLGTAIRRASQ
jgi:hypothetical protein